MTPPAPRGHRSRKRLWALWVLGGLLFVFIYAAWQGSVSTSPSASSSTTRHGDAPLQLVAGPELTQSGTDNVSQIAISPDDRTVAACINEGNALWDARSGKSLATPDQGDAYCANAEFSADGRSVGFQGSLDNGQIVVWDLIHQRVRGRALSDQATSSNAGPFALDPTGHQVAAAYSQLYSETVHDPVQDTNSMVFHAGLTLLPLDATDGASGSETASVEMPTTDVASVVYSPNGHYIAAEGNDTGDNVPTNDAHKLVLLDTSTRHLGRIVALHVDTAALAFAPNSRTLSRLARDAGSLVSERYSIPALRLMSSSTLATRLPPALASETMNAMEVFSPNGRLDAQAQQADGTGSVTVWDTHTGEQIAQMNLGSNFELNATPSIVFSPDGRLFAAGTDAGVVKLWRIVGD